MVQIVRYTETPVGTYDELVIMPGDFDVPVLSGSGGERDGGKKKKVKKNTRITGIWVSQKDTCWNGVSFFGFYIYLPSPSPFSFGGLAGCGWIRRERKKMKDVKAQG